MLIDKEVHLLDSGFPRIPLAFPYQKFYQIFSKKNLSLKAKNLREISRKKDKKKIGIKICLSTLIKKH